MHDMQTRSRALAPRVTPCAAAVALAVTCWLTPQQTLAYEFDTGDSDLKARVDNTVSYTTAYRLKKVNNRLGGTDANGLANNENGDDGDNNFKKGFISNRVDLFSEIDLSYRSFGVRLSGAGWYDHAYMSHNDNDTHSVNSRSVHAGEFTRATQRVHGQNAELLDAFIFGKGEIGDTSGSFRLGRHSLLWGESLFIANGIASAMQPVDVVKLQSSPGSQFKEIIRPVNQISGQLQITPNVTLGSYYQFKWEKSRLPASGSYFSDADYIGDGAERIDTGVPATAVSPPFGPRIVTSLPFTPGFSARPDINPKDSGQGGGQLRFRTENVDYGLYALRYHSKLPGVLVYGTPITNNPAFASGPGSFARYYKGGINVYGGSFSTTLGDLNLAGEVSTRRSLDLQSKGRTSDNGNGDYAIGNSAHAQVSWLYSVAPNFLFKDSIWLGEIAWHRVLSVKSNSKNLDPSSTRDAYGLRTIYAPKFTQALPGWDIETPIGLGYNFKGRSAVIAAFNGISGEHAGDLSLGLKGTYLAQYRFALNYTRYLGMAKQVTDATATTYQYGQTLKDRDFVSFTASTTF